MIKINHKEEKKIADQNDFKKVWIKIKNAFVPTCRDRDSEENVCNLYVCSIITKFLKIENFLFFFFWMIRKIFSFTNEKFLNKNK